MDNQDTSKIEAWLRPLAEKAARAVGDKRTLDARIVVIAAVFAPAIRELEQKLDHAVKVNNSITTHAADREQHVSELERENAALKTDNAAQVAAERQRWGDSIYNELSQTYPEVDGSGCESGDDLDVVIAQIRETICHLKER
jgi:hypothetical protein